MTDLNSAYLSTLYKVQSFQDPIRIGKTHSELDSLLSDHNLTHWSYLTAWNPRSQPHPLEENRARNQALFEKLKSNPDFTILPGVGESPDGRWSEESFLVLGMDEHVARTLAFQFEQNAFVCGEKGKPAKLVFVDFLES